MPHLSEYSSNLFSHETRDQIAVVRFNNPTQRNSLSVRALTELDAIVSHIVNDASLRAVVFTGVEDVFASGANIREVAQLDERTAREFALRGQNLFSQIASAKQLTVAAINGYCMGGGLDFALACDCRIASREAVFAHTGARLGIITGWGGTQRLTKLIGATRALEMFVTARRISSDEALAFELIDRIADPVLDHALNFASRNSHPMRLHHWKQMRGSLRNSVKI